MTDTMTNKIKHTPEPWSLDSDGTTILNDNLSVICDTALSSMYAGEDYENARRIVACVNALEGLSDDALNGGWNFKEMSAYAKKLESEISELKKDAERYRWIKENITEELTPNSLKGEFAVEHKTVYKLPYLMAWADFCGEITFDEAIDTVLGSSHTYQSFGEY